MVMKESIVLTAIAGLVGIAVGAGLLALADFVLAQRPPTRRSARPTSASAPSSRRVAVLVVAGALAGIMPASHAASIKPIEALRTE